MALLTCVSVGCVPPVGSAPTTTSPPAMSPPATSPPATAAPTTAAPGSEHLPAISSFTASTTSAPSPLTTALNWAISDPDGDPLTCRIDLDNNGSFDVSIGSCTSASSRTRTFTGLGTKTVTLEVSDGTNVVTSALALSVAAPASDQYSITLRLGSGMTANQIAAFTTAAAKWESIIKTGLVQATGNLPANYCGTGAPGYPATIDDVLIDAEVTTIDGAGGILGQAGPCQIRAAGGLTTYGVMKFDSADMANLESSGQLANTIVHEMGHVLGIGTFWSSKSLLAGTASTTSRGYIGKAGVGSWNELGGNGNVPVENTGGGGTADAHWRETTFRTELMTGYLNSTNQLSVLSAASLADLGYGIDLAGADAYSLPTSLQSAFQAFSIATSEHNHSHEEIVTLTPVGEV